MTVRSNIFAVAFGVATSVAMFAAPADAATSWVGRGTGAGTALGNWMAATPGFLETLSPTAAIGNGTAIVTLSPLAVTSALKLTASLGTMSTGLPLMTGTSHVIPDVTPLRTSNANGARTITLTQFSSGLNSFGFFLQNYNTIGTGTQGGNVVVTLTDSSGSSSITICGTSLAGACSTLSYGAAIANNAPFPFGPLEYAGSTGVGTCEPTGACHKAEFFGFTGIVGPITNITISGAGGVQYAIGDYFEAPEPASMVLLGAGLLGLGIARRRRNAA